MCNKLKRAFSSVVVHLFLSRKNELKDMEALLVTFIGGLLGGLVYAIVIALENKRKNK